MSRLSHRRSVISRQSKSPNWRRHATRVFLVERLEDRRLLSAVPAISSGLLAQVAKLTASDGAASDSFGISVAVSGNTMVVGSWTQEAVYVFTEPSSGWANMTQTAKLTATDSVVDDFFGKSVAISGNTVVIGAYGANSDQCAAYIFTEPATGWANMTQTAKLTAADGAAYADFGSTVAISGNTVVVGSDTNNAYVFTEPAAGWANMTQNAELTAAGGAPYGMTVAISGNTVVLALPYTSVGSNSDQGAAYVFTEPATGWANTSQAAELTVAHGAAYDEFGVSAAIDGSTVVVGDEDVTVGSSYGQGEAYVFGEPATGWADMTQTAALTASDGVSESYFGASVAISGNTVVAGAPDTYYYYYGGGQSAAYSFVEPGTGWADMTQTAEITATDASYGNNFGLAVAISGNTAVVGADYAMVGGNTNQGAAYVFASFPILVTPPAAQTAVPGQSNLFYLGNLTTQPTDTAPFNVDVNWGDGSPDSVIADLSTAGTIPTDNHTYASSGNYTVTETVTDSGNNTSNTANFVVTVAQLTPTFSNLTSFASVAQGTATQTYSGTIAAGTIIPSGTETVAVTLEGVTQNAPINAQGNFTTTFNTGTLPGSNLLYQVTYAYAGDTAFSAVKDDTTTTLLVMPGNGVEQPVYRLYNPATLDHLFTSDLNEYTTLASDGWIQEGGAFNDYNGLATIGNVTDVPFYRLYNPTTLQHLFTADVNEWTTLTQQGWNLDEVAGYVFPSRVASRQALYRLAVSWSAPPLHLWTTNQNEFSSLIAAGAGGGWSSEGIASYVMGNLNQLAIQLPTTTSADIAITPAITVEVDDSSGNLLTSDDSSVTLAIDASVNAFSGAVLTGTLTEPVVNGVATFGNVSFSAGGNFTLIATDGADAAVASNSIAITGVAVPEYRLYNPVTHDHFFTTDHNQYTTLGSQGWVQEGTPFQVYNGPATLGDNVNTEPLYRLYDTQDAQDWYTANSSVYSAYQGYNGWTGEGIVAYILPTQVAGSVPLYSLSYPGQSNVSMWTTHENEFTTLIAVDGWTSEGITGYVM